MFRLPKCPHCGTIYRYKDVGKAIRNKDNICYHCEKEFKAKIFPGIAVGAGIPIILAVALNIIMLTNMKNLDLIPLFIITMLAILIVMLLIPYFTRFIKTDEDSYKENQK